MKRTLRNVQKEFCHKLLADPKRNAKKAAQAVGRSPRWGQVQLRHAYVRRYLEDVALQTYDKIIAGNQFLAAHEAERASGPTNEQIETSRSAAIATAEEALERLTAFSRANMGDFFRLDDGKPCKECGRGESYAVLDIAASIRKGLGPLIKEYRCEWVGGHRKEAIKLVDSRAATVDVGKFWKLFGEQTQPVGQDREFWSRVMLQLPKDVVVTLHQAMLRASEPTIQIA